MKHNLAIAITMLMLTVSAQQQNNFTDERTVAYNMVTGITAGDTARVQTWDFRDAIVERRGIKRMINYESDSIISILQEGNTLRYRTNLDSLFFIGQRNRISAICDSAGRVEFCLPATAFAMTTCNYAFDGLYGQGHRISRSGESISGIDATGTLILAPNDTVAGIFRAHRHDVSSVKIHANDIDTTQTYHLEQDEYRWFTHNYLVPIAELTINRYFSNQTQIGESFSAYMLDSDDIEENGTPKEGPQFQRIGPKVVVIETNETITLENVYTTTSGSGEDSVSYVLSDILGRVIENKSNIAIHNININRNSLNKGDYLLAVFSGGHLLLTHKFSTR